MRTAEDIVNDYRGRGYSDERLRALAIGRSEPMRTEILALLDALTTPVSETINATDLAQAGGEVPPSDSFIIDDDEESEVIFSASDIGAEAIDSTLVEADSVEGEAVAGETLLGMDSGMEMIAVEVEAEAAEEVEELPAPEFARDESQAPDRTEVSELYPAAASVLAPDSQVFAAEAVDETGLTLPVVKPKKSPLVSAMRDLYASLAPVTSQTMTPSEYLNWNDNPGDENASGIIDLRDELPVNKKAVVNTGPDVREQLEFEFETVVDDDAPVGELWPTAAQVEAAKTAAPASPTAEQEALMLLVEEAIDELEHNGTKRLTPPAIMIDTAPGVEADSNVIHLQPNYGESFAAVESSGIAAEIAATQEESALIKFPSEIMETFEAIIATTPEMSESNAAEKTPLETIPRIELEASQLAMGLDQVLEMEDAARLPEVAAAGDYGALDALVASEIEHHDQQNDTHTTAYDEMVSEMSQLRSWLVEREEALTLKTIETENLAKTLNEHGAIIAQQREALARLQSGAQPDEDVVAWVEAAEAKTCAARSQLVGMQIEMEILQQENKRLTAVIDGNQQELEHLRENAEKHHAHVEELKSAGEKFYAAQGELATMRHEMDALQKEFNILSTGTVPDLMQDKEDLLVVLESKSAESEELHKSLATGQKRNTLFGVGAAAAMFLFIATISSIWIRSGEREAQIEIDKNTLVAERDSALEQQEKIKQEFTQFTKRGRTINRELQQSETRRRQALADLRQTKRRVTTITQEVGSLKNKVRLLKFAVASRPRTNAGAQTTPRTTRRMSTETVSQMPTDNKTRIVIVQNGDNLWKVCKRELGTVNPALLQYVRQVNNIKKHPRHHYDLIYPGDRLVIPTSFTARNTASR